MVVILEAHLAVGVGREILNHHNKVIERSKAPHLHKRVSKGKTRLIQKSFPSSHETGDEEDRKPSKKLRRKIGSSPMSRSWYALLSSHITLIAIKNEAPKGTQNRSLEDKTIQLWKHKLLYYKSNVVFADGEIDLRDVVKIQMRGPTKIALVLEIWDQKIIKQRKSSDFKEEKEMMEVNLELAKEKSDENEGKCKDTIRRAWVLDFSTNPNVAMEWLSGISANWKCAQQILAVKILPNDQNFPKSFQATKLGKTVKTGDILLFKSKHPTGIIIRSWTGGDYDHIALVYRFNNDLLMLEALGGSFIGSGNTEGIKLYSWQDFIAEKWYKQYSAIAVRRLVGPNKVSMRIVIKKLAQFLRTVTYDQTPKYSLNPMKVFTSRPSLSPHDPKRTYFCSELIAKAYKEAGLLRASVPTASYYPSYFQNKKGLKLLKGFELSPDICIDFGEARRNALTDYKE